MYGFAKWNLKRTPQFGLNFFFEKIKLEVLHYIHF